MSVDRESPLEESAFSSVTAAVAVVVLFGRGNLFTSLDSVPAATGVKRKRPTASKVIPNV